MSDRTRNIRNRNSTTVKHIKTYHLFEARFVEFREIVSTIKDICQEFEDNNCECEIFPQDDIKLNIVSLKSRGHIGSIKQPFYLEIDIDMRIIEPKPGNRYLPEWFIENCRRIEDYMISEGFETKPSIRYDNFETIDELSSYVLGLGFYKVKLEFIPNEVPKEI